MKRLKTLITCLLLVITSAAFAQSKTLAKANKFYKVKQYAEAIPLFEKSLEEKQSVPTQTKLAYCYKMVNQIDKAEKLYSDIVYAEKPKDITFYYYGETLMRNGKYAAAKFWFEEYLKKKPGDAKSLRMIESCDRVNSIKPYFGHADAVAFEKNSDSDDNAPVMLGNQMIFCSDRKQKTKLLKQKSGVTGRDYITLYQADQQADGSFSDPVPFSSKINGMNKNTGPISFDASGTLAVFSRNSDIANKKDAYALQLYQAVLEGGKWKNIELIDFCNPAFNYMHPAISPDGKKLFFVSDKPGGVGGTEIYISERKADNGWSRPANLGPRVNTEGHEGFPFYDGEGRLFFSSKGHIGFGGYDVFFTTEENGIWSQPVNVGFPVNSSADDISIYVNPDGKSGMFTSGRSGTSDDIFFFQAIEEGSALAVNQPVMVEPEIVQPEAPAESVVEMVEKSPVVEPAPMVTTPLEEEIAVSSETEVVASQTEEYVDVVEEMTIPAAPTPELDIQVTDIATTDASEEFEPSLSELMAEVENTPEVEIPEETEVVKETFDENTLISIEEEVEEVPEESLSEILAEIETAPAESPAPESPQEAVPAELIEPAKINVKPTAIEETLPIETADMVPTLTLNPANALTEFDADLNTQNIDVDKAYQIPNVNYDFNSVDINADLMAALDELTRIMKANPKIEIQLAGHTASFGNNEKNQQLSEERAEVAAAYLIEQGVERHRVNATGFGESQLLNECVDGMLCSMEQHKVNERLEIKIMRH